MDIGTRRTASKHDVFEHDYGNYLAHLLTSTEMAVMAVNLQAATEAVELVAGSGLYPTVAARLPKLLEDSSLGDLCLLNVKQCVATAFLLDAVAETALPQAVRAQQLAEVFAAKYQVES